MHRQEQLDDVPTGFCECGKTWPCDSQMESDLKRDVLKLAKAERWLSHHNTNSWRSRNSAIGTGFPDLVLARAGITTARLLLVELKQERSKLEPLQEEWAAVLRAVPSIEYYVWRPSDLASGAIAEVLFGPHDPTEAPRP